MLSVMIKFPYDVNRRGILGGGVAAGLLGATGLSAQMANAPKTASELKISVILDGATYSYPDGPTIPSYYVGFREDGRVVFHLGSLGDLTKPGEPPKPHHLGPHHVRIERAGKVLLDADIAAHWWNAQWTYRPAPIAVKKTPAQIVAANRMFPFGDTGAKIAAPANYMFKGPMDSAGITKYMPTTGERPDIGLITDGSGYFMLGQNPGPMLAWAQAAGSCPMHFRDERTGKPIDLLKYPRANAYDLPGLQGAPFLLKGPPDARAPVYSAYGGGWTPQQAHFCEMSYVAHMATLDPGFLEDLQYEANFCVLTDASHSTAKGAIVFGETRGIAWALRQLFMAHAATQDAEAAGVLPAFCHPSSYFKTLLDQSLAYHNKTMSDPREQTFRLIGAENIRFSPWTVDYLLTSLAFGILTGHAGWAPLYLWCLGNVVARTNGTSGYPPGLGTSYRLNTVAGGQDAALPKFTWAQTFDASRR